MAPWRLTFELSGRAGCGFALVERIVGRYRRPLAPPWRAQHLPRCTGAALV